jgi:DnaK suppressor protein
MTLNETKRFTSVLRAKEAELTRSLRCRDEILIEKASDTLDEVQLMRERELAVRNLDRDSNLLRQIHQAISRIAAGTYGLCLHCDEEISPKRMAVVPWAGFCIRCQEKIDLGEIQPDNARQKLLRQPELNKTETGEHWLALRIA